MSDCIFCRIIEGDIPSTRVWEDEHVLVIRDIEPETPIHHLILPKQHFSDLIDLANHPEESAKVMASVAQAAKALVEIENLQERGFRLISNCGPDACQSVLHLHFHFLAGKQMPAHLEPKA